MAGTEQDPTSISPYSYKKGIDYVNQVVEDSQNLPPGVGVLIDPARLLGSAIERANPYYIPIGGLRIYGKNQEDVIKVAAKVDPTKFKPNKTVLFNLKGKEARTAIGAPGFFDRFKTKKTTKKTTAAPAKKATKRVRNSKNIQKQKRANRAKPVEADYSTGNMFKSNNSNDFEPIAAAPAARTGTPAKPMNRGVIGQQTQKNTRSAKQKYMNKTAWMTQEKNVNNAIDDLFKNDDAPTKKQAGMTAAEAIAAMKSKKAPNQATRNANAGQKLLQARAASLRKQQAAIPRNTSKIENFKPEGKIPNSFYNEPAEVPATKTKKTKKAPPSAEKIAANRAAKAALRDKQAANNKARGVMNMTGRKRELSSNLFQGGSRKMRNV